MKGRIINRMFLISIFLGFIFSGFAFAQTKTVTGTVTDVSTGEPLPGVNILIQGTSIGTITNTDGNYTIDVDNPEVVLLFSYIGYLTESIVVGGQTTIDMALSVDILSLEELVVIGYGQQRRADLTGAIGIVEPEEIQKLATNDLTKALNGRIAGVSVQSGGQPGAVPRVKIRGTGSFNNNMPLYVVDGIPIQGADGIANAINDLPMSSIESMQVLKDASAAAIYGSRAANGVILITTKRGEAGKMKVNYSGSYGWQNITNSYDLTNREQYQELVNEATVNGQYADPTLIIMPANDPTSEYYVDDIDTDWQKEAFRTGNIQEHNLSFSGGGKMSNFMVNLNYFDQTSTIQGNGPGYTRYGISVNSDHTRGRFKFGESVHFTHSDVTLMSLVHDNDFMLYTINAIPTIPVHDESTIDGYGSASDVIHGSYTANMIGINNLHENKSKRYRFLGNVYGEIEIIEDLKYKLSLNYERNDWRDYSFIPVHDCGWFYVNNIAKMDDWRGYNQTLNLEQTLTYDKIFGDHHLTAMLGYSVLDASMYRIYGHGEGFDEPYSKVLSQATSGQTIRGDEFHNRLLSYFGRVFYSYGDRYLITGTIRRDGSSRFPPGKKWGNFPSVAIAWKLHNEAFMNSVEFLSQAKIRASYGVLGNQEIPDYRYLAEITPYAHYVLNNQLAPGASQYLFNTPSISWEEKKSTNIGLDLGFLENRILFTFDYYENTSDDMLLEIPVSGVYGSYPEEYPLINGASVKNSGLEFTLGFRQVKGDFTFSFDANLSTLKNEVLELGYGEPVYGAMSRTVVGGEIGEFYGWQRVGIFQTQAEIDALNTSSPTGIYQNVNTRPGDIMFADVTGRDADGNLTGVPDGMVNDDDRVPLGSAIPNLYYGFNFTCGYKNFDFTIAAYGASGNLIHNNVRRAIEGGAGWDAYAASTLNRWTEENPNTDVPRVVMFDPNQNNRDSERWLEKGNYLKISNIEFGYTLPANLLSKIYVDNLRVYVSVQNVYTFTKYSGFDPEFQNDGLWDRGTDHFTRALRNFTDDLGGLPTPRTFRIGVKLGF